MHVTKVVDIFAKIPEQLSLHFSTFFCDLLMILQVCCFSKKKKKETKLCSWAPGIIWGLVHKPLAGAGTEEEAAVAFPSEGAHR